jgi:hypothetical protein
MVIFIVLAALFVVALCVVAAIVGRLFLQPGPEATQDPDLIYTAAAQTVEAELTQTSGGGSVDTAPTATVMVLLPTATVAVQPTSTAVPTNTPPATAVPPPPTATVQAIPCDRATFVKDVTYPDNTEVAVGTTFVKTWRLKNSGSCTWTSGYSVVFVGGDAMNGPASAQLTTGTVPPGGTIDVSVTLKAPDTAGTYRGDWKLRNSAGALFGIGEYAEKSFWVQIKAVVPITVTYDFITQGPNAQWGNAKTILPWGDPGDDNLGVAAESLNRKLEDGKTYSRTLATFPQKITDGMIRGVYPAYTVKGGDHFRATIGLKDGCDVGKVRYSFGYISGGVEAVLKEWVEKCDDMVATVDIDLASLKDQTIQFYLKVTTEGDPNQDYAFWASPRIER